MCPAAALKQQWRHVTLWCITVLPLFWDSQLQALLNQQQRAQTATAGRNCACVCAGEHYNCTRIYGDRTVSVELKHRPEPYQFKFDCVLPENTTQLEIFERKCAAPPLWRATAEQVLAMAALGTDMHNCVMQQHTLHPWRYSYSRAASAELVHAAVMPNALSSGHAGHAQ